MSRIALLGLAVLGAVRWGRLVTAPPYPRLLAPVLLAAVIVLLSRGRSRAVRWAAALAGVLLALPLAGVPVRWLTDLRVARTAELIGHGVGAIPGALVPVLDGGALRTVILLGAGLLVVASAVLLAAGETETPARRVLAAGPLLVLLAVPDTLVPAAAPYLEGVIVLVALAAVAWGPQLGRPAAAAALALAALAAVLVAPALRPVRPWLDVRRLAGSIGDAGGVQFDFRQGFGPLHWPRKGRVVFTVRSPRPAYWKAIDLDTFDGRGFAPAAQPAALLPAPEPTALARGTLSFSVHDLALRSPQIVAAGYALRVEGVPGAATAGTAPGTFAVSPPLRPGSRYAVTAYAPSADPAALADTGAGVDDAAFAPYRTIDLPQGPAIRFAPFHEPDGAAAYAIGGSPYARAYGLARSLAATAPTPYAFTRAVMAHLSRGYRYDEHPAASPLPLLSFLFTSRRGYCQQFAGAMALLLRMGGVPARVVGGFTPGTSDGPGGRWVVTDRDAHDWVEAWFDGVGWVTFDPTPPVDPAIISSVSLPGVAYVAPKRAAATTRRGRSAPVAGHRGRALRAPAPARPAAPLAAGHRAGSDTGVLAGLAILAGLAAAAVALLRRRPRRCAGEAALVAELERALRRTGRPVGGGVTLAELERRFAGHDGAVRYLRTVREARYAGRAAAPSGLDRRALRAALAHGLGPAGRLRAWWALPPRRGPQGARHRRGGPTLRR